ncbi:MAG: DUF4149 domain-containing protein [Pseudomonadota bacterium]
MEIAALLVTALLFGGMVLYSFGFAAFVFTALPAEVAGPTIRRAFPHFYVFVMAASALGALLVIQTDTTAAIMLGLVALTTAPTRQILMPAINAATDTGKKRRFQILHTVSVVITLAHIAAAAYVLARFI